MLGPRLRILVLLGVAALGGLARGEAMDLPAIEARLEAIRLRGPAPLVQADRDHLDALLLELRDACPDVPRRAWFAMRVVVEGGANAAPGAGPEDELEARVTGTVVLWAALQLARNRATGQACLPIDPAAPVWSDDLRPALARPTDRLSFNTRLLLASVVVATYPGVDRGPGLRRLPLRGTAQGGDTRRGRDIVDIAMARVLQVGGDLFAPAPEGEPGAGGAPDQAEPGGTAEGASGQVGPLATAEGASAPAEPPATAEGAPVPAEPPATAEGEPETSVPASPGGDEGTSASGRGEPGRGEGEVPPAPARWPKGRAVLLVLALVGAYTVGSRRGGRPGPGPGAPSDAPGPPGSSPSAGSAPPPSTSPPPGGTASVGSSKASAASPSRSPTTPASGPGDSLLAGMVDLNSLASRLPARYQGAEILGKGGMGVVLRVRDTRLERTVAAKMLLPFLREQPASAQRFLREARALARLDHPNVLTVYDVEEEPWPFFTMQLLEGETLAARLQRQGPLDDAALGKLVEDLGAALAYCHRETLVHRDVKPENLFLTTDGRCVLMDFGLVLDEAQTRVTQEGAIFGTPLYMAPEQMLGLEADARADLYAMALVVLEAASGRLPFEANAYRAKVDGVVLAPEDLGAPGREALAPVLTRCLDRSPTGRYESAEELVEALQAVLQPAPVAADAALASAAGAPSPGGGAEAGALLATVEALRAENLHALKNKFALARTFGGDPQRFGAAFCDPRTLADLRRLLSGPRGLLPRLDQLAELRAACPDAPQGLARASQRLLEARAGLGRLDQQIQRIAAQVEAGSVPANLAEVQGRVLDLSERLGTLVASLREDLASFRVDPVEVLRARAEAFAARGLAFRCEGGSRPRLALDPDDLRHRLEVVVDVLFENACQAGATLVSCRVQRHEGRDRVLVADDGEGLPDGDPERLFAEGVTSREGGSGTGLARARQVLRELGGDLGLRAGGGGGAVASITLPEEVRA